MTQYDQTNRGVLFKNNDKQKETHPDFKGSLNVDGVEYFFDAWKKQSKSGDTFLSCSVKKKEKQSAQKPTPKPEAKTGFDDMSDDIPW